LKKLSTDEIRNTIIAQVQTPEVREHINHLSIVENDSYRERYFELWGLKPTTPEALEAHIWTLWCDPKQWKRNEKRKLGEYHDEYFYMSERDGTGKRPVFMIDTFGGEDAALVEHYHKNPNLAAKCTLRVFEPANQLGNNYRLEVVTSDDDTQIVGWTIVED